MWMKASSCGMSSTSCDAGARRFQVWARRSQGLVCGRTAFSRSRTLRGLCVVRLRLARQKRKRVRRISPNPFLYDWWAPWESNPVPTDYESAALTRRELEARNARMRWRSDFRLHRLAGRTFVPLRLPCCRKPVCSPHPGIQRFSPRRRGSCAACRSATGDAACAAPWLRSAGSARG